MKIVAHVRPKPSQRTSKNGSTTGGKRAERNCRTKTVVRVIQTYMTLVEGGLSNQDGLRATWSIMIRTGTPETSVMMS